MEMKLYMKNNERSNDKMLKVVFGIIGIAVVVGGAYAIYKANQQKQTEKQRESKRKEVYVRDIGERKNPEPTSITKENIEALKEKCWEKYKEAYVKEKLSDCYIQAFSGNNILYYTQRLLGFLNSDQEISINKIIFNIDRLNTSINMIHYKIEDIMKQIPLSKAAFFENRVRSIDSKSLNEKTKELEELIVKIENSKKYKFFKKLYENSIPAYSELLEISDEISNIEDVKPQLNKIKKSLENNGVSFVSWTDDREFDLEKMFQHNAEEAEFPAAIRNSDGEILSKGNYHN